MSPCWELDGQTRTIWGQVLEYPQEQYHTYYYSIRVEGLGDPAGEGTLQETDPFTLRLSASLPLSCHPGDWVECDVRFYAFDYSGGLFSLRNSRLADGISLGATLVQYEGVQVVEDPVTPLWELLARLRHRLGRELDQRLPQREAGLIRAIALGDNSRLSQEDISNFRQLGVSHILVVSGLHMTALGQLCLPALPENRRREGGAQFADRFGALCFPGLDRLFPFCLPGSRHVWSYFGGG